MEPRLSKRMGLGWLLFAGIFLFNPTVGFVDILPDCIGFLMLLKGLSLLADLEERLADAKKKFQILFWAGLAQLLAIWFIYGFLRAHQQEMNPYEMPVTVLLCAFVVAVLYLCVAVPAFRDLFLGLDRLVERFDGRTRGDKPTAEGMKRRTLVFYIAFALCSVLPEFSVLTAFQPSSGSSSTVPEVGAGAPPSFFDKDTGGSLFSVDLYSFVELFRIGAVVLCLIFSLLWMVSYLRYFSRLKADGDWIDRLEAQYRQEILPQTGMLTLRRCTLAFRILCVGILFVLHLRLNYYTAFPGIAFAAFVFVAFAVLGDLLPKQKGRTLTCIVLSVISLGQILVNHAYLVSHLPAESLYHPDVFWHYFAVMLLDVAEIVGTLVLVGYLLQGLYSLAIRYTGVDYGGHEGERLSQSATQRLHQSFHQRFQVIFFLFLGAAIGNIADTILHLHYGWIWLLPFLCSLVALCFYYSAQNELLEEICFHFAKDSRNKSEE